MDTVEIKEQSVLEVSKESFLARLSQADQENLEHLVNKFEVAMKEERRTGSLVVVGGSINKPLPRKDIDILFLRHLDESDPIRNQFSSVYRHAIADFQVFQDLVKRFTEETGLEVDETQTIEPIIDEEFNSESILRHGGSLEVKNTTGAGMPLEFIRIKPYTYSPDELIEKEQPFVVLASTTTIT